MVDKFFLVTGAVVDWPVPPDQHEQFNLSALVSGIRSSGYFLAPNLYIPAENIAVLGLDGAATVVMPAGTRPN